MDEHEKLPILQLNVGANIRGAYRGQKSHTVPAIEEQPEVFLARVFLDTAEGPAAVEVNRQALAHIEALKAVDGDSIIVHRVAEDSYHVVKEVPDPE
jgi:hypothetical protein